MTPPAKSIALQLAAEFLEQLSDHLGSNGCNDYRWPEYVKPAIRRVIMAHHPDVEDDPEILTVYAKLEHGADFMVVDALAALLRMMADEGSEPAA